MLRNIKLHRERPTQELNLDPSCYDADKVPVMEHMWSVDSDLYESTQAHLLQSLNLLRQAVYIFPCFHPFSLSVLHHHFPSNSQLSSTQCIICLKAKCGRMGNQIHITFAFRVSGHKWMVSGSEKRQHFHLSFLCLFYTRRGSTCKLATKGEVENNYGSDAPERNESIA